MMVAVACGTTAETVAQSDEPVSDADTTEEAAEPVIGWETVTAGMTTVDLATISPIVATSSVEALQQFDFGDGPQGGKLEQQTTTSVSITGEPTTGCTGRSIQP